MALGRRGTDRRRRDRHDTSATQGLSAGCIWNMRGSKMKTAIVTFLGAIGTVVSAAAVPGVATAEQLASDWVGMEESRARLVSAVTAVGRHEALVLGLEIALAPGFKTYWRAGGSGGPPPSIDFRSSDNLRGGHCEVAGA